MPENIQHGMRHRRAVDFYLLARAIVLEGGFRVEIEWQDRAHLADVDERLFLKEAAWVILSSGMREAIVRSKFPAVSRAFYNWKSSRQIVGNAESCRRNARKAFAHAGKLNSIIDIATMIDRQGFDSLKGRIGTQGVGFLQSLPFLGPITSYHLAKNLGLDVVKPDRHLVRISMMAGFATPAEFCRSISSTVGERVSVIDLVVWRYATMNPGYNEFLRRYFA
jgi:hypothetical protein